MWKGQKNLLRIDHTRTTRPSYIQKQKGKKEKKKNPVIQQTRLPSPAINQLARFQRKPLNQNYSVRSYFKRRKVEQNLDPQTCMRPIPSKHTSMFENTIESTTECGMNLQGRKEKGDVRNSSLLCRSHLITKNKPIQDERKSGKLHLNVVQISNQYKEKN